MFDPKSSPHSRQVGYVYVRADDDGAMTNARPGTLVRIEGRRPPYIVVDGRIESIVVARWPGRLWFVRVVDAVTAQDERAAGLCTPLKSAGYTRAVAVEVLREVSCSTLFGDHGEAVCAVIARAGQLDLGQVNALALARHPAAGDAYSRAWRTWLSGTGADDAGTEQDFTSVLGSFPTEGHRSRSPIHCGFSVIDGAVWSRAKAIDEPSAFVLDGEGERQLGPLWGTANTALLEAAMAFAAPGISGAADRRIMSAAWSAAIGPVPSGSLAF